MAYTSSDQSLTFRPELQGLRAIAIFLVLLAHAGLTLTSGGFIGVDVFFVLSGYLISGLLLRELADNGRIALMSFYARRLKRLLPALIVMLGITSGAAIYLLSGVEARMQLASAPFAATWTSNLYFAFKTLNYFDEFASRDIFLHTWSLGVEEQFYLIWPLILLVAFATGKASSSTKPNLGGFLFSGIGIAFLASFILSVYWTINLPQSAFYLMPSRIWQFSLGALVQLLLSSGCSGQTRTTIARSDRFWQVTAGLGLTLILGSAIGLHPNLAYPGFWAILPSFGAALVIAAVHVQPVNLSTPLAHPILVWLGDRSYSLYLWHWPVFTLGFSLGFQGQLLPTLGLMLLSLLAAIISYRLIELPFWKGSLSSAKPFRIVSLSLLAMVCVVFTLYHGLLRQLPQTVATTDISNRWRLDLPSIYRMPCDTWYSDDRVQPCVFGTETATKTVLVLGDSIGLQWFSMIPEIFPAPHWRTIVLTKSACAMVDEDYFYQRIGQTYKVCSDWRNAVLDKLGEFKPAVVVMGSSAAYNFTKKQWIEGSIRVFRRVSKAANSVFILPGTPTLGFDGPGCVSRHLAADGHIDPNACLAKNRLKDVGLVTRYLQHAADRFPNIHMLDLNDLVCPGADCNAINAKGTVVFRDAYHLTDSFVRAQIPFIRKRFEAFIKTTP